MGPLVRTPSVPPSETPPNEISPNADEVLNALRGSLEPVKVKPLYQAGLVMLALAMVLLPFAYVAFVGLVGWGLWYHATENATLLSGHGSTRIRTFLYAAPLAVGIIGLFFLVKPLFAPRGSAPPSVPLDREREPLLFAFVERLARMVGAPVPARIELDLQVNASASLRPGVAGVFSDELTLTLGLPLAGGLTLRQFAGVLAHEFGHFRQGTAMRVGAVVYLVSRWFRRVVYERDAWDERLEAAADASHGVWASSALLVTRLFVGLSRGVLRALMWLGQLLSAFLSRQMELDADRYEARLVGGETVERTLCDLELLVAADEQSEALLDQAWRERRICEDLPGLTLACYRRLPPERRASVAASLRDRKTGLFDTHPGDGERIASARLEGSTGTFQLEAPATVLFSDFTELCLATTRVHLERCLGREELRLVPVRALVEEVEAAGAQCQVMDRFFQGLVVRGRTLALADDSLRLSRDPEAAATALSTARQTLEDLAAPLAPVVQRYPELRRKASAVAAMLSAARAGEKVSAADFGLEGEPVGADARDEVLMQELRQSEASLSEVARVIQQRLDAVRSLLRAAETRSDDALSLRRRLDQLLQVSSRMGSACERASWETDQAAIAQIAALYQRGGGRPELVVEGGQRARAVHGHLSGLRSRLGATAHPFRAGVSLADFLVPNLPHADQPTALAAASRMALERFDEVYTQAVGNLAQTAEDAETLFGLDPLNPPAPAPCSVGQAA